ncbi:MAG: hypothetical protein JNK60_19510 [Acidobacteria bacterium]|nr:hypothetical protein [Acidobacteriota bacterium]
MIEKKLHQHAESIRSGVESALEFLESDAPRRLRRAAENMGFVKPRWQSSKGPLLALGLLGAAAFAGWAYLERRKTQELETPEAEPV